MAAPLSVDKKQAQHLADKNRIELEAVGGLEWWKYAINAELETLAFYLRDGLELQEGQQPEEVATRTAIRKLTQYPDWYRRLKATEDAALRHWRKM